MADGAQSNLDRGTDRLAGSSRIGHEKKMDDMKAKYEAERDRKNDETGREEKAD